MLTIFVRFLFFLLLARIAYFVLRGLGLVGSSTRRAGRPEVPPGSPMASGAKSSKPGGTTVDIVDAEFEDLPNSGER